MKPDGAIRLAVVPVELTEVNVLVSRWHRHHQPMQGHRFSLGVVDDAGVFHGAAIVGRPVARLAGHPRSVAEVTRLVTDGTPNACSMLYAAAARACQAIGFERIQTYILDTEPGVSLLAAGWQYQGVRGGGGWARPLQGAKRATSGKAQHPTTPKGLWIKALNDVRPPVEGLLADESDTLTLGLPA